MRYLGLAQRFAELLEEPSRRARESMFAGWLPGRIQRYADRLADIEIMVLDRYEPRDESQPVVGEPYPLLTNIRVAFPGSGAPFIKWTPKRGDFVILIFGARDLDRYFRTGEKALPDDARTFDLNDVIALPYASVANPEIKSTEAAIEFDGETIDAGGDSKLSLRDELRQLRDAIVSAPDGIGYGSALKSLVNGFGAGWPTGTSRLRGG